MKKTTLFSAISAAIFCATTAFSTNDSLVSFVDPAIETQGRSVTEQAFFGQGIDQAQFTRLIDNHDRIYGPIVRQLGASLTIQRLWDDNTENARAGKSGSNWQILMYGGLARNSSMTADGFLVVLCHEQGHLTAGFPAKGRSGDRFSMVGSEGGSDYFATHSCVDKHFSSLGVEEIDPWDSSYDNDAGANFCRKVGGSNCMRKIQGGLVLARFLARGRNVGFDSPDTTQVRTTEYNGYPRTPQCRLDTYMAGAACQTPYNDVNYPTNEQEMSQQSCNNHTGDATRDREAGVRPRCWYAPGT